MKRKDKIYFYPSCPREGYVNPYCIYFKEALSKEFRLLDAKNKVTYMKSATLLHYSFCADIVVLNWIENTANLRLGKLQFLLVLISFFVIKLRHKIIIWMVHNIVPHEGRDKYSDYLTKYLYKHANLIVSHSQEAAYHVFKHAYCDVEYICHPIKKFENKYKGHKKDCELLIWGSILPYKGVAEFLQECTRRSTNRKILILGRCMDENLKMKIQSNCTENIRFEDRFADIDEIAAYVQRSKYVLFPYIGESVSSSGALMDTLAMGGCPIGPNKGAFHDLKEFGMCITYNNYDELFSILDSDSIIIHHDKREQFIIDNSWDAFGKKIKKLVNKVDNRNENFTYRNT